MDLLTLHAGNIWEVHCVSAGGSMFPELASFHSSLLPLTPTPHRNWKAAERHGTASPIAHIFRTAARGCCTVASPSGFVHGRIHSKPSRFGPRSGQEAIEAIYRRGQLWPPYR